MPSRSSMHDRMIDDRWSMGSMVWMDLLEFIFRRFATRVHHCALLDSKICYNVFNQKLGLILNKRPWCSGNMNPFQGFALSSILGGRNFWPRAAQCAQRQRHQAVSSGMV